MNEDELIKLLREKLTITIDVNYNHGNYYESEGIAMVVTLRLGDDVICESNTFVTTPYCEQVSHY